jgi:hypothetical protein
MLCEDEQRRPTSRREERITLVQYQTVTEQRVPVLEFTEHARRQMRRRGIADAFVYQIVAAPHATLQRADGRTAYVYRLVDEQGDWPRYFKVVVEAGAPPRVVTAYDRGGRR